MFDSCDISFLHEVHDQARYMWHSWSIGSWYEFDLHEIPDWLEGGKCKCTTEYIDIPCKGQLVITQFLNSLLLWSSFIGKVSFFISVCMSGKKEGNHEFQWFTRFSFLLPPFWLCFLSCLFWSLNSSSLFLSLRPSLISLSSPPHHFLLLPMATFFLIITPPALPSVFALHSGSPHLSLFSPSAPL